MPAARIRRILVVDDDDAIREEVAATLGMDPALDVSIAHDGRVALQQIATGQFWPDVILLDVMMPVMDGWEFREHQKSDPNLAAIPVIVTTASERSVDATVFLSKPIDRDALLRALEQHARRT